MGAEPCQIMQLARQANDASTPYRWATIEAKGRQSASGSCVTLGRRTCRQCARCRSGPRTQLPRRRVPAQRLRNSWVMPATIAVASTQPMMITNQV